MNDITTTFDTLFTQIRNEEMGGDDQTIILL